MQNCVLFERFLSSPDAGKEKAKDMPRVRLRACVFRKQRGQSVRCLFLPEREMVDGVRRIDERVFEIERLVSELHMKVPCLLQQQPIAE
jgi:hypothetical protein